MSLQIEVLPAGNGSQRVILAGLVADGGAAVLKTDD